MHWAHKDKGNLKANSLTLFIQESPLNLTDTLDVQSRCDTFELNELNRTYGTNEINLVEADCTCATRVKNNHKIIGGDGSSTIGKIIVQCKEQSMRIFCLMKWYASGCWIVFRCWNWYVFFAKMGCVGNGSWASYAFECSCEQVRVNRVSDVKNGGVPGLDHGT